MCRRMQAMIGGPRSTSIWPVTVQRQTCMFLFFTAISVFIDGVHAGLTAQSKLPRFILHIFTALSN